VTASPARAAGRASHRCRARHIPICVPYRALIILSSSPGPLCRGLPVVLAGPASGQTPPVGRTGPPGRRRSPRDVSADGRAPRPAPGVRCSTSSATSAAGCWRRQEGRSPGTAVTAVTAVSGLLSARPRTRRRSAAPATPPFRTNRFWARSHHASSCSLLRPSAAPSAPAAHGTQPFPGTNLANQPGLVRRDRSCVPADQPPRRRLKSPGVFP
jgi:hypothetical protein